MIGATANSPTFAAFVLASLILAIIPGPAVLYLVTRTLSHGRTAGLASIGGIALGNLGCAALGSVGLAAVLAAFLPQFIDPRAAPLEQSLSLGAVFVAIAMCTDTLYVLTAAALAPALGRRAGLRPYGRYVSAATFFGLGLYAALASPRSGPPQPIR